MIVTFRSCQSTVGGPQWTKIVFYLFRSDRRIHAPPPQNQRSTSRLQNWGWCVYFAFFLGSDNSHTTPPTKKIPFDEEGLLWGWCVFRAPLLGQNGPKWTMLVHFGPTNAKFQFGIRSFWPKWSFWPCWSILVQHTFRQYRGHSLDLKSREPKARMRLEYMLESSSRSSLSLALQSQFSWCFGRKQYGYQTQSLAQRAD